MSAVKQLTELDTLDLLVIVLDLNPYEWGKRKLSARQQERHQLTLTEFLNQILIFINAYLLGKHSHKLAIVGTYLNKNAFLYPVASAMIAQPEAKKDDKKKKKKKKGEGNPNSKFVEEYFMKEHQYHQVHEMMLSQIKNLTQNATDTTEANGTAGVTKRGSSIAGALSLALCYVNRMEKDKPLGTKLEPRLLVFQVSTDVSAQYISVMNAIFSAQRMVRHNDCKNHIIQGATIDACILSTEDSAFMQQAAYITEGVYMKPLSQEGLLQYLLVCKG